MIQHTVSDRLQKLPPYLFVEIDKIKRELTKQGKDIIVLGVGDPDLPTPACIVDALSAAAADPANHHYAFDAGMPELRNACAVWFKKRFAVSLDPQTEIFPLLGSKEGIGHFPLAFVNPGDVVLIPEPGYPVYRAATYFAGGIPYFMPLLPENGFLPDFDSIDPQVLHQAKVLYLNYPNNPTAAVATRAFFEKVVAFALEHNIIVCHDAAYSEICYEQDKPCSFLEIPGAKEVGIEFHSLSKTANMAGWRVGFAVGNTALIAGLAKVKANLDSGMFQAVQIAAQTAFEHMDEYLPGLINEYRSRRDLMVDAFNAYGWTVPRPAATFYLWIPVPSGYTSMELTRLLLEKASIVATPGNGFGPSGEGFIRFSLTAQQQRLEEAVYRIKHIVL